MINGFTVISLVSFITCLILAIYIYLKEVRYVFNNRLSKIFVLLCLTLAFCWAIIEFGYRISENFEIANFWLKINVSWYFVMPLLLHFSLIFTENIQLLKKKLTYLIIYGPALLFFIIDIQTNLLYTEPIKQSWGWTYGIPENPIAYGISTTWAAFTGIFCVIIYLEYFLYHKNKRKKHQTKYSIIGLLIPVIIALNTEWLLPMMKINFPEMTVPALTVGLVVICYVNWIYTPFKKRNNYEYIKTRIDHLSS